MPRDTYTKSLLGSDVYAKVRDTPVLVVGAGGIGCELCELSLSGSQLLLARWLVTQFEGRREKSCHQLYDEGLVSIVEMTAGMCVGSVGFCGNKRGSAGLLEATPRVSG